MPVIKLKHVTKDYGHGRGIFDISFKVEEGEVFGFLGPNGAGKTTTIRHLMGFTKAQDGELYINGKNCWQQAANIKRDVGYLPGELAFPKSMTGNHFIKFMAEERQITNMTRTEKLKKLFELDTSEEIKEMSLGTKRKLAIVTAFMHNPKILILDEPTSGLDPVMQERFIQFVLNEKAEGKTILLSSHIFSEVDATCDRIAIIKEGVVVSTIDSSQLKQNSNKAFKIEFASPEDYQKFMENTKFIIPIERPEQNQVKLNLTDEKMKQLFTELTKVKVNFISEIKFTLEDYFMDFYDRKKTVADAEENLQYGLH
ncbi:ABC-2 type transport system ATP-binding protein [Atopostipes suicloacalis DSM 15692]|uniref:ABC-2 type transport system ATP-binding protein n=1 Tax=Atopostipes suicloacalis DSM 15692 TaxID=1121025 RepID=A0A1M4UDQ7_9LACT|nr:ATP-binding cassette domain-containing protein [Atopostipes suicloacalis]SHE54723.1 ABC-2 type transport system ATP-binding protein [Atopostipes suicloacalis DSM 15692]